MDSSSGAKHLINTLQFSSSPSTLSASDMCTFELSCTGCFCWLNFGRNRTKGWRTRRAERENDAIPPENNAIVPASDEPKPQAEFSNDEDVVCSNPPSYQEFLEGEGTDFVYRPEVLETITKTIDDLSQELRTLSVEIHG